MNESTVFANYCINIVYNIKYIISYQKSKSWVDFDFKDWGNH